MGGSVSDPDDASIFKLVGTDPYYDGHTELRLKNNVYFSNWGYFEAHYEAILLGGDTQRKMNELGKIFQLFTGNDFITVNQMNDDRRFMDLTHTISEADGTIAYHRLDRLSLTLQPGWGTICLGRQALTWGNGLVFNPMDLFNPFSPTDIERDYKVGDDMVVTQIVANHMGEVQFLYVPRRDIDSHDIKWDQSSLAGKWHFSVGTTEFDIMGARHYKDYIIGLGSMGYIRNAAWRLDGTWTFLENNQKMGGNKEGFIALVANMDYSWVWWGKNFYGFIEFYYNGLGKSQYTESLIDPYIMERVSRGELFTLGRNYLSGLIQMEPHPLLNLYLTIINNLADPSGIILPRAVWDMAENFQLTVCANLFWGDKETEYGGIKIPLTGLYLKSPNSGFIWLTYFY